MKPTEARARAERIRMLVDAFDNLDGLEKEFERVKPRPTDGDYRAMTIDVEDCSEAGGSGSSFAIELDIATGRLLMPTIRKVIVDELASLGVEV